MTLKAVYDTLDEVPEPFRELYSGEGGVGFRLTGIDGVMLEADHVNLKTALAKERSRASELDKRLRDIGSIDLAQYKEFESRIPELEAALEAANKDRGTAITAAVEERISPVLREKEKITNELQAKLEKATADLLQLQGNVRDRDFRDRFRSEAGKYHVQDGAVEDVIFRAKNFGWKLDDTGNLVAVNAYGDPQYSRKNPTQEIGFAEWISEVLPSEAAHLFKSSQGGGATGSVKSGIRGKAWGDMDTKERSRHISDLIQRGENVQEFISKQVTSK